MGLHKSILPLTAVLLLVAGCMNNGIEWSELSFTRHEPARSDIVGVWTPTEKTLRDIRKRGHYESVAHKIVLSDDGTFAMVNMPDWWTDGFGESHGKFDSGNGTWRIVSEKERFRTIFMIELDFGNHTDDIHLSGHKAPYQIYIGVGDPDSGHHMLFDRNDKA